MINFMLSLSITLKINNKFLIINLSLFFVNFMCRRSWCTRLFESIIYTWKKPIRWQAFLMSCMTRDRCAEPCLNPDKSTTGTLAVSGCKFGSWEVGFTELSGTCDQPLSCALFPVENELELSSFSMLDRWLNSILERKIDI